MNCCPNGLADIAVLLCVLLFKVRYQIFNELYVFGLAAKGLIQSHFLEHLQKGGVPAAPSGTATLLRLSPSHRFCPRTLLAVTYFRHSQLPWLDGRCVQGPGTYSPRHG